MRGEDMTKHHVQLSVRSSSSPSSCCWRHDDIVDNIVVRLRRSSGVQKCGSSCNWESWEKCTHTILTPVKYVTSDDDEDDDEDAVDDDDNFMMMTNPTATLCVMKLRSPDLSKLGPPGIVSSTFRSIVISRWWWWRRKKMLMQTFIQPSPPWVLVWMLSSRNPTALRDHFH